MTPSKDQLDAADALFRKAANFLWREFGLGPEDAPVLMLAYIIACTSMREPQSNIGD
ncbi:hypothetical protein WHZ78_02445 [Bradyrhizobium symbiodeficiens]|uniref:hypothetical protein n=1 Tax=Bradyrhizobium symbiodeficiens TaxID=1404367 RepID=UPI0030D0DBB2